MSGRVREIGTSSNSASAHICGFARHCLIWGYSTGSSHPTALWCLLSLLIGVGSTCVRLLGAVWWGSPKACRMPVTSTSLCQWQMFWEAVLLPELPWKSGKRSIDRSWLLNHVEKRQSDERLLGKSWWDSQPGLVPNQVSENLPLTLKLPFPALQLPCCFLPMFSISGCNRSGFR